MDDTQLVFTIIIGCVILLIPVVSFLREMILWNRGTCEKTNKEWELFDIDSNGSRGYKSDNQTLWVSWRFLDINN